MGGRYFHLSMQNSSYSLVQMSVQSESEIFVEFRERPMSERASVFVNTMTKVKDKMNRTEKTAFDRDRNLKSRIFLCSKPLHGNVNIMHKKSFTLIEEAFFVIQIVKYIINM